MSMDRLEAAGIVNCCEGERGELPDTWDRHQPAASGGCSHQLPDIRIDRRDGSEHGGGVPRPVPRMAADRPMPSPPAAPRG